MPNHQEWPDADPSTRRWLELADAVAAPLRRPIRSLLVISAFVLGVAALVAAVGLTRSTTGSVVDLMTQASSMQLRVTDSSDLDQPWTAKDPTGAAAWRDSMAVSQQLAGVQGVESVCPTRTFTSVNNQVTRLRPTLGDGAAGNAWFQGTLMVTSVDYLTQQELRIARGSWSVVQNSLDAANVALGSTAAATLGVSDVGPGSAVWVNGRPVSVAAILAPSNDPANDATAYFSPGTLPYLTDQLDNSWLVRGEPGYTEPLAKALPLALAPASPGKITVSTPPQLAQLQQGINSDLGRLLGVIGAVILVLSALTAGTTMFLSVQHREAEIALRRAMGASRASIWRLFTYEGLMVGAVGGIIGTGVGVGVTALLVRANHWPLTLGADLPVTGFAMGLVAGAGASVVPALYAARRDPAGILRLV